MLFPLVHVYTGYIFKALSTGYGFPTARLVALQSHLIFFSTFLFSLNDRSPSSGGDDPGIKQIKLFVLFLEGEDQRRNSDALPSLMGAMAELFIKTTPMLYNAL